MLMDRQGEAHKDSDRETSHCFSGRVLPRKTAECRSECPLPSLELVTHKTHKCCQTGAYRTLNKRGHIPGVFPHEVTSCSKGRMGCWEFTGDLLRRTLPPPKVLSALFMFFPNLFPSLLTIFIFLSICTSQSCWLGRSQWNYGSQFTVLWHLFHMIWQVSPQRNNQWLLFSGNPLLCVCLKGIRPSWEGRVSRLWEWVAMIERMEEGE